MADYVSVPFEAEPFNIEQAIYEYIQSVFPEWSPKDASLTTVISEAYAQQVAELMRLATDVPPAIWLYYGRLVGITPNAAQAALGYTTWTMIDDAGYTIPEGTTLRLLIGGEDFAAFETVDDFVVPNGDLTTPVGAVQIRALEDGTRSSGLATTPELMNILDYVEGVTLTGPTTGGVDEEDLDVYLDRLARRLQLLADRPILPRDFEIYTSSVFPGVSRALAIDGYDPAGGGSFDNEKMISLAALDTDGNPVDAPTKDEIKTALEAVREVNFVVNMIDPTYTEIVIDVTVMAYAGFSAAEVEAAIAEEIGRYLDPLQWGQPDYGNAPVEWQRQTTLRYLEVVSVINRVNGVDYIQDMTLNGGVVDVALAGVAPLPDATPTVTATVNLP